MIRRLALAASLLSTGFAGPVRAADPAPATEASSVAAPSVTVVPATRREIVATSVVTGTLLPRETVMVGADVDGLRVEALLVDEGDEVKAGQVLARLATDLVDVDLARSTSQLARAEAAITQANAQVLEAEATASEAESSLKRTQSLSNKGIVGQDILDQRISAAASATARLAAARQGVALAEADRAATEAERRTLELRRSKAEIKAPTDGLVLSRAVRLGSVVSSAGGALFEIARDNRIELDAEVSETALGRIRQGQKATVFLPGDETLEGTVRLVSPKVDSATRLGRVHIALPASPLLRVGAFARGEVETAKATGVVVPRTAVVTDETGATVQVVVDGVVETRQVQLGLGSGNDVEIAKGVAEGETVVSLAGTFLRDGDRVTPVEAGARTAEVAR